MRKCGIRSIQYHAHSMTRWTANTTRWIPASLLIRAAVSSVSLPLVLACRRLAPIAFGSSIGCGGTVSTFSATTRPCPMSGRSCVGAVSSSSGSITAGLSKPWTSDIEMEDAPEVSSDHVAVIPSTTTTSVPVLALPQPPKHANTVVLQAPQFKGLGFPPSKRLASETVTLPKPAEMLRMKSTPSRPLSPHRTLHQVLYYHQILPHSARKLRKHLQKCSLWHQRRSPGRLCLFPQWRTRNPR